MTHHDADSWHSFEALEVLLGISRRTLQRRIKAGLVEVRSIGGTRVARPVVSEDTHDTDAPDDATATTGADANQAPNDSATALVVAALDRVRALEDERAALVRDALAARDQVADVRVELAGVRARVDVATRDLADERQRRELAETERARLELAAETAERRAEAERERAARLAEVARVPAWRWRRRRRLLAG